jgi:5-methylcytosine-specific restriction protein A
VSGHGWNSSRRQNHRAGTGWAEARAARRVLARDGHRCQIRGPHCIGHATECDHVVPLSVTGTAGDHDANKQAACTVCHKAKTEAEKQAGRAGKSRRRPAERHPGFIDPGDVE